MGNLLRIGVPAAEINLQQGKKRKLNEKEDEAEEKFSPSRFVYHQVFVYITLVIDKNF